MKRKISKQRLLKELEGNMFKCGVYTNKNSLASTEKQRLACQDFAVKRGWTVLKKRYDDFCDESIPALKRPAMQKLFDDIEIREVEYVLFYTFDCLTTSVEEVARIFRLFEERNIFFNDIKPVEFSVENGKFCGYATTIASFMDSKEEVAQFKTKAEGKGRKAI